MYSSDYTVFHRATLLAPIFGNYIYKCTFTAGTSIRKPMFYVACKSKQQTQKLAVRALHRHGVCVSVDRKIWKQKSKQKPKLIGLF